MIIVWLIGLGIAAVAVGIIVATRIYNSRVDEKVAATVRWQETQATIQDAALERLDKYTWYPGFTFFYAVNNEYYSGEFYLKADAAESDDLLKSLLHQKFPIQYDPENPSAWYIEATIAGKEIIQRLSADYPPDSGFYRDHGDQPFDLHLDS